MTIVIEYEYTIGYYYSKESIESSDGKYSRVFRIRLAPFSLNQLVISTSLEDISYEDDLKHLAAAKSKADSLLLSTMNEFRLKLLPFLTTLHTVNLALNQSESARKGSKVEKTMIAGIEEVEEETISAKVVKTTVTNQEENEQQPFSQVVTNDVVLTYLQTVKYNTYYLMNKIYTVFDYFAILERKSITIKMAQFSLKQMLNDIIKLFANESEQHGIEFNYKNEAIRMDNAISDERRIKQILITILASMLQAATAAGETFDSKSHIEFLVNLDKSSKKLTTDHPSLKFDISLSSPIASVGTPQHETNYRTYLPLKSTSGTSSIFTKIDFTVIQEIVKIIGPYAIKFEESQETISPLQSFEQQQTNEMKSEQPLEILIKSTKNDLINEDAQAVELEKEQINSERNSSSNSSPPRLPTQQMNNTYNNTSMQYKTRRVQFSIYMDFVNLRKETQQQQQHNSFMGQRVSGSIESSMEISKHRMSITSSYNQPFSIPREGSSLFKLQRVQSEDRSNHSNSFSYSNNNNNNSNNNNNFLFSNPFLAAAAATNNINNNNYQMHTLTPHSHNSSTLQLSTELHNSLSSQQLCLAAPSRHNKLNSNDSLNSQSIISLKYSFNQMCAPLGVALSQVIPSRPTSTTGIPLSSQQSAAAAANTNLPPLPRLKSHSTTVASHQQLDSSTIKTLSCIENSFNNANTENIDVEVDAIDLEGSQQSSLHNQIEKQQQQQTVWSLRHRNKVQEYFLNGLQSDQIVETDTKETKPKKRSLIQNYEVQTFVEDKQSAQNSPFQNSHYPNQDQELSFSTSISIIQPK